MRNGACRFLPLAALATLSLAARPALAQDSRSIQAVATVIAPPPAYQWQPDTAATRPDSSVVRMSVRGIGLLDVAQAGDAAIRVSLPARGMVRVTVDYVAN